MFKLSKDEKRRIAAKLGLALIIISLLLMIDLVSKHIVFDINEIGDEGKSWGIVGWRSHQNFGTTFFNRLGITISNVAYVITNIGLLLLTLFIVAFTEKKSTAIALSILAAGIMGNTIDRMAFSFVRDIVYIPWFRSGDAGTFNFADVFVVIGAMVWSFHSIRDIWSK